MNILRRLPLSRLLLVCALVVAIGACATALASALGGGPTPAPRPLALAIHEALAAPPVQGVSANVQLTNHLLEGANLATGGGEASQLTSSPLLSGASGRLWIAKDGRLRLELQAEKGDTQILYDGHTLKLYDAATNTLYEFAPPAAHQGADTARSARRLHHHARGARKARAAASSASGRSEPPSLQQIEEAISHLRKHAQVSGAEPADVAGQPAYSMRVSPSEAGSLFGGVELSWDAVHGVPLRAAVYSSTSSSPVIELAATEISYGPVDSSVFDFKLPPEVKIDHVSTHTRSSAGTSGSGEHEHLHLSTRGHGLSTIAVLQGSAQKGSESSSSSQPEALPQVKINGINASELATPLGTLLSFERSGVRYVLAGSVTPSALEAIAKGL